MSRMERTKAKVPKDSSSTRLGLNLVGQYAIGISNEEEEEKKRGLSERRRMQIKCCEQQRFKLQADIHDILEAVRDIEAKQVELAEHSKWITKIKKSIMKQMQKGECDEPIPEAFGPGHESSAAGNDGEEEEVDDD